MRRQRKPALLMITAILVTIFCVAVPAGPAFACYSYVPVGLEATPRESSVLLEWAPPTSYGDLTLAGYNVHRWDEETGCENLLNDSPVTDCSFTDETVEPGHVYVYYVVAYYAEEGESGASNEVKVTIAGENPDGWPAPSGLEAFPIAGAIRLEWYEPDYAGEWGLVGYFVFRANEEGGWCPEQMTEAPVTGCGWNDYSAEPGAAYCYFVKAYYASGEMSGPSNEVEVCLESEGGDGGGDDGGSGGDGAEVSPPRDLEAFAQDKSICLRWEAPETGAEAIIGYYVYRSDSEYGFDGEPLNDFTVSECAWVDNTAQAGPTYTYYVTAVYGDGQETEGSNEVEISLTSKSVTLTIDNETAEVNGQPVVMDQPPIIVDGRTMLPFRFIAENLGADVTWDPDTNTVTAVWEGITVVLTVGSQTAYVDGEPMLVNVPPVIVNGRTLVPLRFLANAFGWDLQWNDVTRTVTVRIETGPDGA